ncbi:DUF1566 domain-containing protein [Idiomarina aquatica]|uniref:Repeat protein (TIGR02543 family) n=1 Tax=Idiomarina aquatica TaxID=1327752 RepID=A0AA94JDU9_9GAMM|nr:DUF1566 domain-containing protein [Idiomarina aquatica]RUO45167.1 hypothetical protein CWE23_03865 [Idiomarina aquatica]
MDRIYASLRRMFLAGAGLLLCSFSLTSHAATPESTDARFRDNGDGTVTDLTTKLTWQRCASNYRWNGDSCELSGERTDFNETLQLADASSVAGYDDWRLPTRAELRGLVYCSSGSPAFYLADTDAEQCEGVFTEPTIERTYFQFDVNTTYWANQYDEVAGTAATVSFSSGETVMRRATANYATRLVRQGPVTANLLRISVDGTGAGAIEVGDLSCTGECHANLSDGEHVTLTAKPAPGTVFDGWGGSCSGSAPTCEVRADERVNVTAQFSLNMAESRFKLHSDGTAYDPQAGLVWYRCVYGQEWVHGECVDYGQAGTYTEIQAELNTLVLAQQSDWRLPSQTELGSRIYCQMNEKLGVAHTQACEGRTLSLYRDSVVTPQYWNFDVWTTTAGELDHSRLVFDGSGDWQTVDSTAEAFAVLVKDVPQNHAYLRFRFNGSGSGAIEFDSQAVCEDDCHRFAAKGSTLVLTAQADADSEFVGWSGACSGIGECRLTAKDGQQVQAIFMKQSTSRYVNNLDGTVTDREHQLTWKICPAGAVVRSSGQGHRCVHQAGASDITNVLATIDDYSYAGHSDWRVASIDELNSIVMCSPGVWKQEGQERCEYGGTDLKIHPELLQYASASGGLGHVASRDLHEQATESNPVYWGIDFASGEQVVTNSWSHSVLLVRDAPSAPVTIGVQFSPSYAGMVTLQQGQVTASCDTDCTHGVTDQAKLTLMATGLPGYEFVGWQGDCGGDAALCEVSPEQLQSGDTFNVQPQFKVLLGTERYRWVNEQSIEDKATGLIWQRCAVGSTWREGACRDTAESLYAQSAAEYADAVEFDGADNWRLPTVSEMRTLLMCRDARSPRWPNQKGECETTFEALQQLDLSTFGWLPGSGHRYLVTLDDGSGYRRFNMFKGDLTAADLPGFVRLVREAQAAERNEQRLAVTIDGASDSGTVSVLPQQLECVESCELSFEANTYIVLNATAAAGYQFDGWSGACSGNGATCLVRMSEARRVVASFVPQVSNARYVLHNDGTATDRWSGLTWQRCAYGQTWADGRCEGAAETVTVSEAQALQQDGWQLPSQAQLATLVYCASGQPSYWTQAQQQCRADTDSPTIKDGVLFGMDDSFKARPWSSTLNDTGNVAATIDFIHGVEYQQSSSRATVWLVRGETLPLTVQTQGDGGVGVWVEPVNANCGVLCEYSLAKNTTVTLTVNAADNTTFSHWSGACSGSALTCQVAMTEAKSVTAHYDWKVLSVGAQDTDNGRVEVAQNSVRYGDDVSFSATPDYGYRIGNIQACGAIERNGNSFNVANVTQDCVITVTFEPVLYQVTIQASEGVSISPGSAQVVMGQTQAFRLTVNEGYELTSVSGCGGVLDGLVYTTAAVEEDCQVVAEAQQKRYQVVFELGEPGTLVSGSLEQTVVHGGAAAAPEFSVARGWEFTGWSVTFDKVTEDLNVTAQYRQIPIVYYVSLSYRGEGTLTPEGTQEVGAGDSLSISAVPAEGWKTASYVDSTCGSGAWDGGDYVIDSVTADCSIEFRFVRPSQGSGALLLIMAVEAQKLNDSERNK